MPIYRYNHPTTIERIDIALVEGSFTREADRVRLQQIRARAKTVIAYGACASTGGINALNGVYGAWTDSIPMIVVSGQVKRETCMSSYPGLGLRQLGDQEADIISLVEGMTKYAVQLTDPGEARPCLDLAIDLSTDGRQGPVWIDVPIDVQSAEMPETDAAMPRRVMGASQSGDDLDAAAGEVVERLAHAERPVILAGTGVRLAGAGDELVSVAERLGVPLTTAWTHDLLSNDHPLWCGRPGTIGDRAGNFAVQNADLLIVLGSRLNVRQVSYNWTSFAPGAYIVQVDIDAAELRKPTVRPHLGIVGDAGGFLLALEAQ